MTPSAHLEPPEQIEASSVCLEVTDQTTGQTYRRHLPIHYLENAVGILLSGETLEGQPAQLAFLSANTAARIRDVIGQGADTHRCK
ncbi:MAG TPA: hypothetical protein VN611_08765 [Patescibacteria group bacterium]|nr:hypothetical protein [Patescibacteria group bacterium]